MNGVVVFLLAISLLIVGIAIAMLFLTTAINLIT